MACRWLKIRKLLNLAHKMAWVFFSQYTKCCHASDIFISPNLKYFNWGFWNTQPPFIINGDEQTSPEQDLTRLKLEPSLRNVSLHWFEKEPQASWLLTSIPKQMPDVTCGKSRSQKLEDIYIIQFMEQVLQHSSRNNGTSNHKDVHFHFHNRNHKATRVICGNPIK